MQQILVSKLLQQPVIANRQQVATVERVVFDLARGTVLGVIVKVGRKSRRVLYRDDIFELTETGVKIATDSALVTIKRRSLADIAARARQHVIGARALTEDGEQFGVVTDALLAAPAPILTHLLIRENGGERLIPRDQIKKLGADTVICLDQVAKGRATWQNESATLAAPT